MKGKRETVDQIRAFNRFYTVLLGLLNQTYYDSGYSVTETRILFELHENGPVSAHRLIELLQLDKSYVSRIIRGFEKKGLILRETAPEDRRALCIRLTDGGRAETEGLIARTDQELLRRIDGFSPEDCRELCSAMGRIIALFSRHESGQEGQP